MIPGIELPDAEGEFDLGVVTLEPEVRVVGRVVDRDGRGIEGASILLGVPGSRRRATLPIAGITRTPSGRFVIHDPAVTSDESGNFSIGELLIGEQIRIEVVHDDYQAANAMVVVPAADEVELTLETAAFVSGQVLDPEGDTVSQATVTLVPTTAAASPGRGRNARSDRTNDSGQFTVKVKPETEYTIEASARDWAPSRRQTIEVSDRGLEGLELYLQTGVTLSGRITGVDGSPLAGVLVMSRSNKRSRSSVDGRYRLEGLPLGQASIVARRDDGTSRVERVDLVAGENRLDISFSGGIVTGSVYTADGSAVGQAVVQLAPSGEDGRRARRRRVSSDRSGRYRFEDVPGGSYVLKASKVGAGSSPEQGIELFEGDEAAIDLYLEPRSQIQGLVTGLSIDLLSQLRVSAQGSSTPGSAPVRSRSLRAAVDYEGRFAFEDLEPGSWEVVGQLAAEGWEVRRRVELGRDETARIELDFSETGEELTFNLVLDGAPLAGARVTVTGTGTPRVAESDYQGQVRLSGIEGERAVVGVRTSAALLRDREIALPARPAPTLEYSTGSFEISVLDASTEAAVTSGNVELRFGETTLGRARLSPSGTAAFAVEQGSYTLVVTTPGHPAYETPVQIGPSEARTVIQLPAH